MATSRDVIKPDSPLASADNDDSVQHQGSGAESH
jgi:hypothetical protein